MNVAAKIFLALNLDKASSLRKISATVAFRYLIEMHRYGFISINQQQIERICKRFKIGDFIAACAVHYPCK